MPNKNTGGRHASKSSKQLIGGSGSSYTNNRPLPNMFVMSLNSKKYVNAEETVSGKDASFTNIGALDNSGLYIVSDISFSSVPKCSTQPSSNDELANKQYVDANSIIAGDTSGNPTRIQLKKTNSTNISTSICKINTSNKVGRGELQFRTGNPDDVLEDEDPINYFFIDWRQNNAFVRLRGQGSYAFDEAGYVRLVVGTLTADTVSETSDDRLKHNEEEIPNALELIDQLKPLKYDKTGEMYDADYTGDVSGVSHKEIGFIAQDIQKIPYLAFAVGDDEDGEPLSVNYNTFIGVNTQGIKDLHTKVKSLEERVQLLEDFITKNN